MYTRQPYCSQTITVWAFRRFVVSNNWTEHLSVAVWIFCSWTYDLCRQPLWSIASPRRTAIDQSTQDKTREIRGLRTNPSCERMDSALFSSESLPFVYSDLIDAFRAIPRPSARRPYSHANPKSPAMSSVSWFGAEIFLTTQRPIWQDWSSYLPGFHLIRVQPDRRFILYVGTQRSGCLATSISFFFCSSDEMGSQMEHLWSWFLTSA